jgi:RhtB (resistance to homoserine/threonine) family protein
MNNLSLIATVTLVHLLAVISPGPDFLITVRNSLAYSRKTGIWTAVGIGLGITVHIFYSVAGLAFVISQSILIFNFIKLLGAGYLIYIGVKSFRATGASLEIKNGEARPDIPALQGLKIGFLTNALNPKATVFFLSLFTLVISPHSPPPLLITVSIIMIINTMAWFALVAIFLTQQRIRGIFERFQGAFHKIFGGLLIALGIKIAVTER